MGRCGEYIHSPEICVSLTDFQNEPVFILVSYEASVTAVTKLLINKWTCYLCSAAAVVRDWSIIVILS